MVLSVGRAFALLAALVVAIVPALPAHAHMHAVDSAVMLHSSVDGDRDRDAHGLPQHAGDCCLASHVPVIPIIAAVPLPVTIARISLRAGDFSSPPDAASEALPEPPRPAA